MSKVMTMAYILYETIWFAIVYIFVTWSLYETRWFAIVYIFVTIAYLSILKWSYEYSVIVYMIIRSIEI